MSKYFIALLAVCLAAYSSAQDTLSTEQLAPITYSFQVENGRIKGKGADFLIEEMSKAQFTMIGEYHGSMRISELTNAMIPILDGLGYKDLVLEVGPITGQILNGLNKEVPQKLKAINEKYLVVDGDGDHITPIPFFSNVEDADFLATAKANGWNLIGIDQEFLTGFPMLIDIMFENLNKEARIKNQPLYQRAVDSLKMYQVDYISKDISLYDRIKKSEILQNYFEAVSEEPLNVAVVDAFKKSNHIYWLYSQRQWFENNATRITYMKEQLRTQLLQKDFDISKDKLLIKMGGYHLSKGFSPLGLYEVGNTLNELAAFHGNSTLNIAFSNRYYTEEGQVIDILESTQEYQQRYKDLDQMGRKDEWVVIDLRPMIKGHFYRPVKYKFNKYIKDLVKRYDLLIIPRTEISPTPNYTKG